MTVFSECLLSEISYQSTSSLEFSLREVGGFGVVFKRMFLFMAHKAIS